MVRTSPPRASRTARRRIGAIGWPFVMIAGALVLLGATSLRHREVSDIKAITALGPHQGECARCHSEHGNEAGVTNAYALIGPDDNALCDQCHTEAWAGGSYAGTITYNSGSHGTSSAMIWPGPEPPARMEAGAAEKCVNCHDPHGWTDGAGVVPHLQLAREENLCITCHDGGTAASNIKLDIEKPFRHPVILTGRHTGPLESSETDFGITPTNNRHAECADCHNPHVARSDGGTPVTAPAMSNTNIGVSRVAVTNRDAGLAPAFTFVRGDETLLAGPAAEYQLCFKCHSSWTSQPAGQTDLATVLNPANASYHPVEDAGKNANISTDAFVSPWTSTSFTGCGDCHGSDSSTNRGPHGSVNQYILRNPYTASPALRSMSSNELCFDCHAHDVYADSLSLEGTLGASRFNKTGVTWGHAEHFEAGVTCYSCHVTHGAATQPHLIATGRNPGITTYTESSTGGSCTSSCHGEQSYTVNYAR